MRLKKKKKILGANYVDVVPFVPILERYNLRTFDEDEWRFK